MSDPDFPPLDGQKVAVVGAGMAGLTAARRLTKAGAVVTVFEKSRGLGGRLATRRIEAGGADHGAQYVTAREPGFKAWIARAKALGSVASWTPRGKDGDEDWLVGMPGMSGMVAALVDGYEVVCERTVTAITESDGGYRLGFTDGAEVAGFHRVVVAVPGPQAQALLGAFGAPFDRLSEAALAPCWTLIAEFAGPFDPGYDIARDRGDLAWIARSASKPGRSGDTWIAQANPAWSRSHLEMDKEAIAPVLFAKLADALGPLPETVRIAAHRWRYALVEKALGTPFLIAPDGRIGACGDYMIAPRVEAAWASGEALAEAMTARARTDAPA